MADFPFGTVIDGRYKLVSRLGSGGMADVYLAQDEQLGRKVALKLLHRRFAADPGFVERFRREAQSAAGLQHPNIVSVYDRGSFEDTYYIAMEYLPGRSLKQLIRDESPVAPVRAIDLTIQILQAARFAHRHGVIHRDLKPHNVIVDDSDHVKVTDFGIARAGASDMTETGSIMGTAQYLSPEQAQGHAVSAGSDLYSVAVVLYEMLTGRVPFDAESAVTIALKHVSETPTAPTQLNASVPPELEQVVMWALNKNPVDRPQDADQFIDALERAKAVIESGPGGGRTAAMTALAGVGAYKAAAATTAPATTRRADLLVGEGNGGPPLIEEPPPYEPERRSQWPWIALVILALLIGGGVAAYLVLRPQKVIVPSVVRLSVGSASTILQNDNLNVTTIDVPSTTAQNTVIHQSIQAGRKVDSGSTVTLTVSSGLGNVTVPPVSSLPLGQAEAKLRRAGLMVSNVVQQNSSTVSSGQVIYTDPAAGSSEPARYGVEVFVSSGKAKVPVPDVTGDTESDAKNALSQFTVTTTTAPSSTVSAGSVISQSPTGGKALAPGSTVTLVIATAPTTVKVPDVVGQNAVSAAATLASAGFSVQQTSQTVQKPAKNNQVLAEQPGGNTTQKKGSTVTIVVGSYQPTTSTGTTTSTTKSTPTTTTPTTGGSG